MKDRVFEGRMHVFGNNIDTDQIYPGQYLDVTDHQEMAGYCMQGASERFGSEFVPGDILVAGTNFGCGSSRENAAIALKVRGVSCIVARSYARIFYRNAINLGLPLIVCADIDRVKGHGETLRVHLDEGTAANLSSGASAGIEPISQYALRILDAGGIKPLMMLQEENGI